MDTIFALSTPPGMSGVAVVRISGAQALAALARLGVGAVTPRQATLRGLYDHTRLIDRALILYFEEGASFTGEKIVEFQIHGSVSIANQLLEILGSIPEFRLAQAGEFTRRAFENDQLDLLEVEALSDLLAAETAAQHAQAIHGFSGAGRQQIDICRADLLSLLALFEAGIDFSDQELPDDLYERAGQALQILAETFQQALAGQPYAERLRAGFEVALVGPPNIGKSTLLNHLAGRDAAITSEIAGTTRDVIEVRMELDGLPVTLLDTAGLRQSDDQIEAIGIARTEARAAAADLRVFLTDQNNPPLLTPQKDDIILTGKADLSGDVIDAISGVTGQGVDALVAKIVALLSARVAQVGPITNMRQKEGLEAASQYLQAARDLLQAAEIQPELISFELQRALGRLDFITGRVDVEEVLGEIFSTFCMGK